MRRLKLTALVATSLAAAALWGCGSNLDSADQDGEEVPIASARAVGIDSCAVCHNNGGPQLPKWLESGHGNAANSPVDLNSPGFPDYGMLGGDESCPTCHDPQGDGRKLTADLTGNVPRPVVGCEACHGGGQYHNGLGPIPYPVPSVDRCAQCHNDDFPHLPHAPFGGSIAENYGRSAHAGSVQAFAARCTRCHTDEGFRTYGAVTRSAGHDALEEFFADKPVPEDVTAVQCRTCHDGHSSRLRADPIAVSQDSQGAPVAPPAQVFSRQFKLCTSCHQAFLSYTFVPPEDPEDPEERGFFTYRLDESVYGAGGDPGSAEYHNPIVNSRGTYEEVITDTHFPGTYLRAQTDEDGNVLTDDDGNPLPDEEVAVVGYNINAADEKACTLCHDPHGATKFEQPFAGGIAEEWGNTEGFHGDYLNFAYEEGEECAKCHSGTEFVKLTEGLPAEELDPDQARVVACVSCHDLQAKTADGTAFELGSLRTFQNQDGTPAELFSFPSGRTLPYEGLEGNALCMTCHSGRESGASVDAQLAEEDPDGDGVADTESGTFSRPPSLHYRPAGATLFGNRAEGLYQFEGKVYASKFEHVASNDLCVECHNEHTGRLYIRSPGFGPTGCVTCHTNVTADPEEDYAGALAQIRDIRMNGSLADYDGDGDAAEGIYYEVDTLRNELWARLQATGVTGTISRPTNLTTYAQVRSWYNLDLTRRDPGAYAHNSAYVIQLLVDSLEVLGQTVNSVTENPFVRADGGHFDSAGEPFRHWDEDGFVEVECSKCHSSEGAAYYFANGSLISAEQYTPYTMGISAGLACETCHQAPFAATGDDPALRPVASVTFPSGVAIADAELAEDSSTLCMTCHQGRASKQSVDNAQPGSDGIYRFTNIHYYAAAASFFGSETQGGYEYAGKVYAGRMTFPGVHDAPGFTTCTGCHMTDDPGHDFKPKVTTCALCHGLPEGGTDFEDLGLFLSDNFGDIQALKDQLLGLIEESGVVVDLTSSRPFSNITTKQQLQACYNWQVADKEPCGYIHNPDYVRQLLFDSITDFGGTPVRPRPGDDT